MKNTVKSTRAGRERAALLLHLPAASPHLLEQSLTRMAVSILESGRADVLHGNGVCRSCAQIVMLRDSGGYGDVSHTRPETITFNPHTSAGMYSPGSSA